MIATHYGDPIRAQSRSVILILTINNQSTKFNPN